MMPRRSFNNITLIAFTAFLIALMVLPIPVQAETQTFDVNRVISEGNSWRTALPDRPVESVEVILRREPGSSTDTYVNMRFEGAETFESGRRAQVDRSSNHALTWNVNAEPQGRPLILNAYNGEVYVDRIRVRYADSLPADTARARLSDDSDLAERESDRDTVERCREARVSTPSIEIAEVEPRGGLFSGKYQIEGSVRGTCIQEVGYFEDGRLQEKIAFPFDDRFRREEFEVNVRSGRGGELRAYTVDGKEEVIPVDDELRSERSALW